MKNWTRRNAAGCGLKKTRISSQIGLNCHPWNYLAPLCNSVFQFQLQNKPPPYLRRRVISRQAGGGGKKYEVGRYPYTFIRAESSLFQWWSSVLIARRIKSLDDELLTNILWNKLAAACVLMLRRRCWGIAQYGNVWRIRRTASVRSATSRLKRVNDLP
jgi:hypothetical protein